MYFKFSDAENGSINIDLLKDDLTDFDDDKDGINTVADIYAYTLFLLMKNDESINQQVLDAIGKISNLIDEQETNE